MPIRLVTPEDAGAIVAILRTSIEESAITFYERVPTVGEVRTRIGTVGFAKAYAGITLPNPASVALRARLGFEVVGTFERTGCKLGPWHDSLWMQKALSGCDERPGELRTPAALSTDPVVAAAFAKATATA
jgi:L-amino acid N-acyltransferase YncA